jgi:hypothetical protein
VEALYKLALELEKMEKVAKAVTGFGLALVFNHFEMLTRRNPRCVIITRDMVFTPQLRLFLMVGSLTFT